MKEKILQLRKEGKTYNEIVEILGCAKSTVCYHCGEGQKEKNLKRQRKNRRNIKTIIYNKFRKFLRYKLKNFKKGTRDKLTNSKFNYVTGFEKITKNPYCYLTGRKIDLFDTKTYELDHIIPHSKGGKNTLSNLGLTCRDANRCKADLSLEDFINLCKEVLVHKGYKVTKL